MDDSTESIEADISAPEVAQIKHAVEKLTSTEKEIISEVLKRDEEVNSLEKNRLKELKRDLDDLAERGIPDGTEHLYGRVCVRCCEPLGLVVNRGTLCPWCKKKICKNCRRPLGDSSWICTMCYKEREIKAESGAWFYDSLPKKKKVQYGSSLLKKFVRRRKTMKRQLSKSRRISEDSLATSGEIEHTIDQTFRRVESHQPDNEYVVVDQFHDGDISVHEGNVASYNSNESEAAALDSVCEGAENEASDDAFNDASFNELESVKTSDGMQEYIEQNEISISSTSGDEVVAYHVEEDAAEEDTDVVVDDTVEEKVEQNDVKVNVAEEDISHENLAGHYRAGNTEVRIADDDDSVADETSNIEEDSEGNIDAESAMSMASSNIEEEGTTVIVASRAAESSESIELNVASTVKDDTVNDTSCVADNNAAVSRTSNVAEDETKESGKMLPGGDSEDRDFSQKLRMFQQNDSGSNYTTPKMRGTNSKVNLKDDAVTDIHEETKDYDHGNAGDDKIFLRSNADISHEDEKIVKVINNNDQFLEVEMKSSSHSSEKAVDVEMSQYSETKLQPFDENKPIEAFLQGLKEEGNERKLSEEENGDTEVHDMEAIQNKEFTQAEADMAYYDTDEIPFEEDAATKDAEKKDIDEDELVVSMEDTVERVSVEMRENSEMCKKESHSNVEEENPHQSHEAVKDAEKEANDEVKETTDDEYEADYDDNSVKTSAKVEKENVHESDEESGVKDVKNFIKLCEERDAKSRDASNSKKSAISSEKDVAFDTPHESIALETGSELQQDESKESHEEIAFVESASHNKKEDEITSESNAEKVSFDQDTGIQNGHCNKSDIDSIFDEYIQKEQIGKRLDSVGSLDSLDSNRSDDLYETAETQVAGEILLGLKYDTSAQTFEIQIHKAKDLVAVDTERNTSDPYVKTYLLQDSVKTKKKKTKVKRHTLEPMFDEIITYKIGYEELLEKVLSVEVWHNDKFRHNVFLGEARITISDYIASGYSLEESVPHPEYYQLAKRGKTGNELRHVGEIVMEIMYIPPGNQSKKTKASDPVSGQLFVKCVEGKNLDGGEGTSPFCELVVLPVKNKSKDTKHKTSVEAKTLNPYWDQEFVFDSITFNDLSSKVLQVSVHDAAAGRKERKFLGAVRLGMGETDQEFDDSNEKECMAWQKMLQEPNKRVSATLNLRSTLDTLKSSAALPPVLVERTEEIPEQVQVRDRKSGSVLSQTSISSFNDTSSLRGLSLKPRFKGQPDQYSLQSYGSMMSIYSDAGGYGSVPISGEILFSIQYDNIAGVFDVHVSKAKNIAVANKKTRTSDPYVKTYLLPDKSKDSKKKTTFKKKTLNPEWDESIKYKIGQKDLMKRTLQVSVWNNEKFGQNDFLGEVQVQMAQYVDCGHSLDFHEPIWYTLQELAPVSIGGPGYKGALTVGLKFEPIDGEVGKLLVDIKEANELAAADVKTLSNPFVKSYLLPDRTRKSKRKSTFKKGTVNPKWNEKFEYNGVALGELEHRVLELTVWDHEAHSNDFLGGTRIGLGRGDEHWHDCLGKETSVWNAMLEHPGIWVEYSIPLRDSMTSRKGLDLKPPEMDVFHLPIVQKSDPLVNKQGDGIASEITIPPLDPMMRIGLMFITPKSSEDKSKKKGTLKIALKGARNLPTRPGGVSPSTYCKCFIQPRKSNWRFKTELYKRSPEPKWEKEFSFEGIQMEELSSKCLNIVIFEDSDVSIGMVRLGPGIMQMSWDDSTGREIEIWKAMIENPDQWNNLMIPLRMDAEISSGSVFEDDESNIYAETTKPAPTVQEKKSNSNSAVTAKELALQSMGTEASKVVDIIKSNEPAKKQDLRSLSRSQDNLDRNFRPLSYIQEDAEEPGADADHRVRTPSVRKNPIVQISAPPTQTSSIPRVMISEDTDKNEKEWNPVPEEIQFEEDELPEPASSNLSRVSKFGASRESLTSMTSVYSGVSPIYGSVPVKGSIQFAMKYDTGANSFEVHIFKAKEIAAVDAKKNVSDPYVKVYLLPDKTKASKRKTKAKHKTINPIWNEMIHYKCSLDELSLRTLMVTIWNFDRFGRNIFLGEVPVIMSDVIEAGGLHQMNAEWYDLQEKTPHNSQMLYKGELTIGLMFRDGDMDKKDKKKGKEKKKSTSVPSGKIQVHVVKGRGLPVGDSNGLCDPYCKFYLLPLKQAKTKRKTTIIKRAQNPTWDYRAEYIADFDDLPELGIEFSVYDYDKHSRNDFLGCIRVNLGGQTGKWDDAIGVEREAWQTMIEHPNKWHQFTIPLRASSDPRSKVDFM